MSLLKKTNIFKRRLNTVEKIEQFLTEELPGLAHGNRSAEQSFELSKQYLAQLGNPQDSHPVIHIAGTSGKGSIAYMIDAMLRAHDKRTGLLVSPHVYDIRERIQFNGGFVAEKQFIQAANRVIDLVKQQPEDARLTYRRLMTLIGFTASARQRIDYFVLETGMGGTFDSTNTVKRDDKYAVLTQIGIDHTELLGTTYAQIAQHKAGIVTKNSWVSALLQENTVNHVFAEAFEHAKAHVSLVQASGNYMVDNVLLALDCVRRVSERDGWHFDEETAKQAAARVYIPGRFEKRSLGEKTIILDGAHNPQKLAAFAWRLAHEEYSPATIIFATSSSKDVEASLNALKPAVHTIICTEFFKSKPHLPVQATPAESVAEIAKKLGIKNVYAIKNPLQALQKALQFEETIGVTGSFYLLGEIDKVM